MPFKRAGLLQRTFRPRHSFRIRFQCPLSGQVCCNTAQFKQVRAFDLAPAAAVAADAAAPTDVTAATGRTVVDLLRIDDPQGLAPYGRHFRFPFWTPECLVVLDARTLLVVDDNNFPATGGRSTTDPDPTEWIWLRARDRAGFAVSP